MMVARYELMLKRMFSVNVSATSGLHQDDKYITYIQYSSKALKYSEVIVKFRWWASREPDDRRDTGLNWLKLVSTG